MMIQVEILACCANLATVFFFTPEEVEPLAPGDDDKTHGMETAQHSRRRYRQHFFLATTLRVGSGAPLVQSRVARQPFE